MSDYLTTREFDKWTEAADGKLDRILRAQEEQARFNLDVTGRLSTLEASRPSERLTALEENQNNAGKLSARLSGLISAVTTAVVNGVFMAIGGQR